VAGDDDAGQAKVVKARKKQAGEKKAVAAKSRPKPKAKPKARAKARAEAEVEGEESQARAPMKEIAPRAVRRIAEIAQEINRRQP
jgi:hypothetical protein